MSAATAKNVVSSDDPEPLDPLEIVQASYLLSVIESGSYERIHDDLWGAHLHAVRPMEPQIGYVAHDPSWFDLARTVHTAKLPLTRSPEFREVRYKHFVKLLADHPDPTMIRAFRAAVAKEGKRPDRPDLRAKDAGTTKATDAASHPDNADPVVQAWRSHSYELADWAILRFRNRTDSHGAYKSDHSQYTAKTEATRQTLVDHFYGVPGKRIGLHTGDSWESNLGKWLGIDIDKHGDEGDAEVNLRFALAVYALLVSLGFRPLLIDSNGRGGYHIFVVFDRPVPLVELFYFGRFLVRGWQEAGFEKMPEVFPKQDAITQKNPYGNWMRLPGQHHKNPGHWSKVWDGERWLEGEEAIRLLLDAKGDDPDHIPDAAAAFMGEAKDRKKKTGGPTVFYADDPARDAELAREALGYLGAAYFDKYDPWMQVGFALYPLGFTGLTLWSEWSRQGSKHQPGDCEAKWPTIDEGNVTLASLFYWAKQQGWPGPQPLSDAEKERARAKQEGETPLDVDALLKRIDEAAEAKNCEPLLDDVVWLKQMGRLRKEHPEKYAIGWGRLKKIAGFPAQFAGEAIKAHTKPAKKTGAKTKEKSSEGGKREGDPGRFFVEYTDTDGFLAHIGEDKQGNVRKEPVANFTARITRELIRQSDGTRRYEITAKNIKGDEAKATIDAETFAKYGLGGILGADFAVGANREKHVRAGIQFLSSIDGIPRSYSYPHTGWVRHGEFDLYLHGGGALGFDGPTHLVKIKDENGWRYEPAPDAQAEHIKVELDPALSKYVLPPPPLEPAIRKAAINASLDIMKLGRTGRPNAPGIASVTVSVPYRAILKPSSGVIHYSGGTGALKTTTGVLSLQHLAPAHTYKDPVPATWDSTVNSLQRLQHDAKESLLFVDDMIADGPNAEREQAKVSATFSAQGNQSGKRRMQGNLSMAAGMDPRCTLLSNGETDPTRRSANGRSLIVKFTPEIKDQDIKGSVCVEDLKPHQKAAEDGVFAAAMATYIEWITGRRNQVLEKFQGEADRLFEKVKGTAQGAHPRCAHIIAELGAAFRLFVDFAVKVEGAITEAEGEKIVAEQWEGLQTLVGDQAQTQIETDPGRRFLGLIASTLESGRAYLAGEDGNEPRGLESRAGWRFVSRHGSSIPSGWEPAQPSAMKIGWVDDKHVYLNRDAALAAAQRFAAEQRSSLNGGREIWCRLKEMGLLKTDVRGGKVRYDVRKTLEGARRDVGELPLYALWDDSEDKESQSN